MRDRPQRIGRIREHALDVSLDSHIALQRDGLAAACLHRSDHAGGRIGISIVINRYVIAARAGKPRGRSANAPATAGDQKDWPWHSRLRLFA